MGFFDDTMLSIGRGLAQTAVQAATEASGYDVGGTLNALFGNQQAMGGADLVKLSGDVGSSSLPLTDITQLQSSIEQQQGEIMGLGTKLDAVAVGISAIQSDFTIIEQLLQQINQEILYNTWQAQDDLMVSVAENIRTAYKRYGQLVARAGTTGSNPVADFVKSILNDFSGPAAAINTLSDVLLGDGQAKGALELWSEMVAPLVAAGLIDYRDAAVQYIAYYRKVAYTQLQGTNLLMEAYNFNPDALGPSDPGSSTDAWTNYQALLIAQENTFIRFLSPIIAGAITGGYDSESGQFGYTAYSAAFQLDPSLQGLMAAPVDQPSAYYEPSSIYAAAETLLAILRVTDVADRRLVVHMLYSSKMIKDVVSSVVLTLDSGGSDQATLQPSRSADLGKTIYSNFTDDARFDQNFNAQWFHLKRFVFENAADGSSIPDGDYNLTNLNGQDGLVPIETYAGNYHNIKNPFLDPGPLSYTMTISPASPYAFMNFMAYVCPGGG